MPALKIINFYQKISLHSQTWLQPIALLAARLLVAKVFLTSGLAKWNGFLKFDINTYDLFLYEFFCPDPVRPGALLLCDAETLDYAEGSSMISVIKAFAVTAGVMEIILPLLLIMGLFTRFAALSLLGMVAFIQLAVFPEWGHWWNPAAWWAVVLLVILSVGPGSLSLDRLFKIEK